MKILMIVLLLLFGCNNHIAKANSEMSDMQIVYPQWENYSRVMPLLSFNECGVNIKGKSGTTFITTNITLENKIGSSYKYVTSWSGATSEMGHDYVMMQ